MGYRLNLANIPTRLKRFLIVFGFAVGLFTFSCGFLLNRTELTYTTLPLENFTYRVAYDRLVVLLVDGLAFDFIRKESNSYTDNIVGHMSYINQLLQTPHARLVHFIADPPTTTMQRLKGLVTGSMPTFVDAGSNFGSTELNEDNLIHQWRRTKKRVQFVGDDTWMGLFPNSFNEAHPYPSFNVKDLDTVDKAVISYVSAALENPQGYTEWDILIGHMLGVDHCGHTYGPAHPEMRRKLREVDQFVRIVVGKLNENDLLVVMGDHGMTASGDHGGDSPAELDAALLVYSLRGFHHEPGNATTRIAQIDLVPTLAMATGVPVPYSNLGVCVKKLLPPDTDIRQCLLGNFIQMINYTLTYRSEIGPFPIGNELTQFLNELTPLDRSGLAALAQNLTTDKMEHLLHELQQAFRQHWTRFDLPRMWTGLCVMLSASLLGICFELPCPRSVLIVFVVQVITALTFTLFPTLNTLQLSVSLIVFVFGTVILWIKVLNRFVTAPLHLGPLILIVPLAGSYFSNSFLVHELQVTIFLLQSLLVYQFIQVILRAFSRHSSFNPLHIASFVFLMLLVRLTRLIEVCREESFPSSSCRLNTDPWIAKPLTKLSYTEAHSVVWFRLALPIGILLLVMFFHSKWLRKRNRKIALLHLGTLIAGLCLVGCWLLDASQVVLPQASWYSTSSLHLVRVYFARGLLLVLLLCFVCATTLLSRVATALGDQSSSVADPHTGSQIEKSYSCDRCLPAYPTNAPGDVSALGVWLCATLILLPLFGIMSFLNEVHMVPMLCIPLSIMIYSVIHLRCSIFPTTDRSCLPHLLESATSWSVVVFICLLDNLSFYATGHQTTIAGIPWDAAFAAYAGDHHTQFLPALMVMVHLFAGPILMTFSLPLFVLVPLSSRLTGALNYVSECQGSVGLELGALKPSHISCAITSLFWRFFSTKALLTFACALSACILRRHLMVWKIFAPRLLFSAASLLVTGVMLTLVRLLLVNCVFRTHHKVK